MDRYRIELTEHEVEERRALRAAFVKGTVADYRGRRVRVWGEFLTDATVSAYQVEPVEDPVPPSWMVRVAAEDHAERAVLHDAHTARAAVRFEGREVRVVQEATEQRGDRVVWVFTLEAVAA
jgi:hypothetical protein